MPAVRPDLFEAVSGEAHVALAVSGGSDSMALMGLAHDWAGSRGKPRLSVLTVDHGLRSASAVEAATVGQRAATLGLDHVTLSWIGPKPSAGLQAKARQARYDLMAAWCRANGAACLLTAHTLNDQAETLLMRLARTTSIDSLAGIHPIAHWQGVKLVRPLLEQEREQLRGYLRTRHADWIEDPSNADERFERVRIRKMLAGQGGCGWRINERQLADLARECRDASEVLDGLASDYLSSALTIHRQGFGTVPLASFLALHQTIRLRVLRRAIAYFGSGATPLRAEVAAVAEALDTAGVRRTLGGALIWARRSEILVAREAGRISEQPVVVPEEGTVLWDQRFRVTAPAGSAVFPARLVPGLAGLDDVPQAIRFTLPAVQRAGQDPELAGSEPSGGVHARFAPIRTL